MFPCYGVAQGGINKEKKKKKKKKISSKPILSHRASHGTRSIVSHQLAWCDCGAGVYVHYVNESV